MKINKKAVIVTAGAGLLSFIGSFFVAWMIGGEGPAAGSRQAASGGQDTPEKPAGFSEPFIDLTATARPEQSKPQKSLTEKELEDLIYQVRTQIRQYKEKLAGLEKRQQRLQIVQKELKKDIEKLNNLRIEVAACVERLKSERDRLLKTRIEISQREKTNLLAIAAAYDKMDSASASKIIANMCLGSNSGEKIKVFGGKGSNLEDAVKILHYMQERTKAKLLAEMVNFEPKLAAVLCERLKQIVEE